MYQRSNTMRTELLVAIDQETNILKKNKLLAKINSKTLKEFETQFVTGISIPEKSYSGLVTIRTKGNAIIESEVPNQCKHVSNYRKLNKARDSFAYLENLSTHLKNIKPEKNVNDYSNMSNASRKTSSTSVLNYPDV